VAAVAQRGERTGLGDRIDVEWLARLLQQGGDVFRCQTVAHPQRGEAVDFGKGPQHAHVPALAHILEGVGWRVGKFEVSLVEHHDHLFRHPRHEPVDRRLIDHGAGGVVRVGDENEAGFVGDRIRHRIEVVHEFRVRHFDVVRAEQRGHQLVNHERVFGGDEFRIRIQKRVAQQFDDFVRTVAENHVREVHAKLLGDGAAQAVTAAVRIDVGLLEGFPHRDFRQRRGA